MRDRNRGFTLIELMIALAVIGILIAIALPSYRSYALRATRATGKAFLTQVLAKQESYFNDRKTYAGTLSALGYSADTVYLDSNGAVGATSSTGSFSVTISLCGSASANVACTTLPVTGVKVLATAINKQLSDTSCKFISLWTDGTKGSSDASLNSSTSTCWSG